jgi:hypothetical protein
MATTGGIRKVAARLTARPKAQTGDAGGRVKSRSRTETPRECLAQPAGGLGGWISSTTIPPPRGLDEMT